MGSGLALKMGLKRASLAGLKLNVDVAKDLLWVTVLPPNILVTAVVDGCPNIGCPKPCD